MNRTPSEPGTSRPAMALSLSLLVLTGLLLSALQVTPALAADGGDAQQPAGGAAPAANTNWLEELIPGLDYAAWYQAQTGYPPDATYFGAYALEPMSNTLYIGFGTARPAERDGALLASTDGSTLSATHVLSEQGFIDMTAAGGTLYIPGADPCCSDNWDWGNTYVYAPPGPVVKHRNLPDVIHSWGLWFDEGDGTLYAAVSSHQGDYETYTGEIWSSTDGAASWTRLADRDDGVGQYRTYDIIGFNDKLYVTWNDVYGQPCGLAGSSDGGATWTRFLAGQTSCRARLQLYQGELLALKGDRTALFAINTSGGIATHDFPGFRASAQAYNYLASDSSDRLYMITDDGGVVRSSDLTTWETVVSTDVAFVSIAFWPEVNRIIVGDRSADAKLWKIDAAASSGVTLPPPPAVTIARSNGDLLLDWCGTAGEYRVYRSASPYFASRSANKIATPTACELLDNNLGGADVIGDVDHNYFYLVRAEDPAGILSLNSNRVGEFDFSTVPGN